MNGAEDHHAALLPAIGAVAIHDPVIHMPEALAGTQPGV
jgi:hypothetical protein